MALRSSRSAKAGQKKGIYGQGRVGEAGGLLWTIHLNDIEP